MFATNISLNPGTVKLFKGSVIFTEGIRVYQFTWSDLISSIKILGHVKFTRQTPYPQPVKTPKNKVIMKPDLPVRRPLRDSKDPDRLVAISRSRVIRDDVSTS